MTRFPSLFSGADALRPAVLLSSMLICSCSGGPGSDVDEQPDTPPVAKAVVVGNAFDTASNSDAITTTVRAGFEVVLTGKESITLDDPIISFAWSASNAAAEDVQLFTRNSSTVSFVAPNVAEPLEFTLTVFDSDGGMDTVTATVDVVPVDDLDRFLTYLGVPDTFTVIASTRQPLTADVPFDVSVTKRVEYTAQNGTLQTFESAPVTKSATWLVATGVDPSDPDFVGNPRLEFRIPQLILDEINRDKLNLPPLDPGRALILERRDVDTADVTVVISATPQAGTGGDPSQVVIFLQDVSRADIPVVNQNLQQSQGEFNGAVVELAVPLDTLKRTSGGGNQQENRDTARLYYEAIDPGATKDTLNKWLEANCFSTDVREEYHADAHAVYTNNFDLGFGRDMFVKTQCADEDRTANTTFMDGDVASVVVNYPTLEAAGKKLDPVIAVAMEFALPKPPFDPDPEFDPTQRITTFYVFAPDEITGEFTRVLSADFDNRGEKYVPGSCTVCHGGRPNISPSATTFPMNGDVDAIFLPWDLDSFLYMDSDNPAEIDQARPDIANPFIAPQSLQLLADLTRANQQADFKALNEAVLSTYPPDAPVRRLVHYWYQQPGTPEPDFASNELQSDTFVRDAVPPGWADDNPDSPVAPRDLYLDVVAQNCRACHTQLASQSQPIFETFENFNTLAGPTTPLVFQEGTMPLARLTMDRFWANVFADSGMTAADILRTQFAAEGTPGEVSAVINVEAPLSVAPCTAPVTVTRGDAVRLNSEGSLFADAFQWELDPLPGDISLTASSTASTSFVASAGRNYDVTLTASNAQGSAQATCTIVVVNNLPAAKDFTRVVIEGNAIDIGIRDELLVDCPG
ncbi:MAG: PKD domain-containing protein, partial [Gammaproteobacteria bacterium]